MKRLFFSFVYFKMDTSQVIIIYEVIKIRIENVYEKIQDNNIKIFHHGIPGVKSISVEADNKYGIFINHNEIENPDEEFLVAAHEYGHCMTGSTHPLYSPFDIIIRHEYKADRKAILDFLPIDKLKEAINYGCKTIFEFSTYLDVPEAFVIKAFKHYTAMNLI